MTSIDIDIFSDLVGEIHDCAIAPDRWPHTLERIVDFVDCRSAAISTVDPFERRTRFLFQWGVEPRFVQLYREGFQALNPSLTSSWYMKPAEPFTSSGFLGDEEFFGSRFYREWCVPQGIIDTMCVIIAKSATRFGALSLVRGSDHGRFTDAEAEKVRLLAPHVSRAAVIGDLLDARRLQSEMLSATLDLMTVGAVLADRKGHIVHANHAAIHLFEKRGAPLTLGGQLTGPDSGSTHQIKDAIERAVHDDPARLGSFGIAVPISGPDSTDLAAWVLPLGSGVRGELAAPFAADVAIFIRELGDTSPFPGELLVKRYGITPAECRVLILLTKGQTLREAAGTLGISEATAKTHLQHLFDKTDTQRQADLVRLVMSVLAPAASHTVHHSHEMASPILAA